MKRNVSPMAVIEAMGRNLKRHSPAIECQFFETSEDVPDPRDLNPEKKNLMVFDDLLLQKQNKCEAYYTVSQKKEATKLWAVTLSNLNRF